MLGGFCVFVTSLGWSLETTLSSGNRKLYFLLPLGVRFLAPPHWPPDVLAVSPTARRSVTCALSVAARCDAGHVL